MGMSKAVLFLTACVFVGMSSPALAGKGGGGGGGGAHGASIQQEAGTRAQPNVFLIRAKMNNVYPTSKSRK
jgi:hypothetical protein